MDCYFCHIQSNHKGLIKNVLMNWTLTTATWALDLKKLSKISTVQFVVCTLVSCVPSYNHLTLDACKLYHGKEREEA